MNTKSDLVRKKKVNANPFHKISLPNHDQKTIILKKKKIIFHKIYKNKKMYIFEILNQCKMYIEDIAVHNIPRENSFKYFQPVLPNIYQYISCVI